MLIFKILFDEVDRGPRHEKKKKTFSYTPFKRYKYIAFS